MDVVAAWRRTWSGAERVALPRVLRAGREGPATSPALRQRAKEDDTSLHELPSLLPP